MISIIVPVARIPDNFDLVRELFLEPETDVEVIYIVGPGVSDNFSLKYDQERVYQADKKGRGHALVQGSKQARGEYVIFNHADTLLPGGWQRAVMDTLRNRKIKGGGFSLRFDKDNWYLRLLIRLSDILFHLTGELWGDRSIFVRQDVLNQFLAKIDVPIMEDVIMSRCLRRYGRVKLLKDMVCTSGDAFHRRGVIRHTLRIILCRTMFSLGFKQSLIWRCYYGEKY